MDWVNNTKIVKLNLNKEKPCHKLGYCPYGGIVEMFLLTNEGKVNCKLFGHHCPMFYNAENVSEEDAKEMESKE